MQDLSDIVDRVSTLLEREGLMLATAESCTGGMIAAALTSRPGSSGLFDRGFVTYSNAAKTDMLGVSEESLKTHGAVSAPVADAMASGALIHSRADCAVSVTGIAGPSGAGPDKPVGLVYIGATRRNGSAQTTMRRFSGDRDSVRMQAACAALLFLIETLETTP